MRGPLGTYRVWWFYHTVDGHFHGDRTVKAVSREEARQMVVDELNAQGVNDPETCATFILPEAKETHEHTFAA